MTWVLPTAQTGHSADADLQFLIVYNCEYDPIINFYVGRGKPSSGFNFELGVCSCCKIRVYYAPFWGSIELIIFCPKM